MSEDRLERGRRVLFVSDVHLTPAEPETFLLFLEFLEKEVAGARALYLLGDLFDFWVGPRQAARPGWGEIFARTRALRESGTEVYFQRGNRDFALDGAFATAQGLRVLADIAETTLGDRRVLLTHGDLLCTRDVRYQRMRRVIRSRPARWLLDRLPWRVAAGLAGGFRRASDAEISRKSSWVLDPDMALAKEWLERGFDALIFGHVHRGETYRVSLADREATIFVLGSWENRPGFVEWDGTRLAMRAYGGARLVPAAGPESP